MSERVRDVFGAVHAGTPDGNDFTLCGDAMEGEKGDEEMEPTTARINCERCIRVIIYAKSIRAPEIAMAAPKRAKGGR